MAKMNKKVSPMQYDLGKILLIFFTLFATQPILGFDGITTDSNGNVIIFNRKDFKPEAERLRPLAEQGNPKAQYSLGMMYLNGLGVTQDDQQAAILIRKAAEQGIAEAQYNIGEMYLDGAGVSKDEQQATSWFRKAADQGHTEAQKKLDSLEQPYWPKISLDTFIGENDSYLIDCFKNVDGVDKVFGTECYIMDKKSVIRNDLYAEVTSKHYKYLIDDDGALKETGIIMSSESSKGMMIDSNGQYYEANVMVDTTSRRKIKRYQFNCLTKEVREVGLNWLSVKPTSISYNEMNYACSLSNDKKASGTHIESKLEPTPSKDTSQKNQTEGLAGLSCQSLWKARNQIFHDKGYCFKGEAKEVFGNAGCQYDKASLVPLIESEKEFVKSIRAIEENKGCIR